MYTELYRRASIQAQRNKNQFDQAQRNFERACRRERIAAWFLFGLILIGIGAVLTGILNAMVQTIWK